MSIAELWAEAERERRKLVMNEAVWYVYHCYKNHSISFGTRENAEIVAHSFCKRRGVEITQNEEIDIAIDAKDLYKEYCD